MPTYDYKCDACEHVWEEFQSIKAQPTKKCPSCGKSKARRQIGGGAGLIFKGTGFYLTDYRRFKLVVEKRTKQTSKRDPRISWGEPALALVDSKKNSTCKQFPSSRSMIQRASDIPILNP